MVSNRFESPRMALDGRSNSLQLPLIASDCLSWPLIASDRARLADPMGSGLSVARTVFLSNGRLPHHWQHRVFSDGEVRSPLMALDCS